MKVLTADDNRSSNVILHKNDKKILSLLCSNIRLPLSKIAKLVRLSRQSVEYRVNVMKENHLIAGSRAVINIKKLGYGSYHFFINIQNARFEEKFISECLASEYVNALISYSGKWNYELSIMEKSPLEANKRFFSLIKDIPVLEYFPCILVDNVKSAVLPGIVAEGLPALKHIKNDPSFSKQFLLPKQDYKPDEIDRKILYALSQNAQENFSEIGKRVGLTNDAVSYRIKKLIRAGLILEFRPVIDFSVLSLSVHTILLKMSGRSIEKDNKFKEYLKKSNIVLWATELFSGWDFLLYMLHKTPSEIHDFLNEIRRSFPDYIQTYEVLFAYREHKYSYMTEEMRNQSSK